MRSLAHLRNPDATGREGRAWAGARTITPGPARTVQFHQLQEPSRVQEVPRQLRGGSDYENASYSVARPTSVRPGNMGSYFLSDPIVFQSYFKVHWEDMFGASANLSEGTRRMNPLPNPTIRGSKEGQALQAYNPWPSASQLAGFYPTAEIKAI